MKRLPASILLYDWKAPTQRICHPLHPEQGHIACGGTLIVHEIDSLCFRNGRWVIGPGSPVWLAGLDLETAIAEVCDDVFDDRPGFEPDHAVILIRRENIAPKDRNRAEDDPLFLLYSDEDDLLTVLERFCSQLVAAVRQHQNPSPGEKVAP